MENYKNTPLWDNSLTVEERLDYLVKALTLEEKIACPVSYTHLDVYKRQSVHRGFR